MSRDTSLDTVQTPDNVKNFKDLFTRTLIGYFKNDIFLINNLLEISDKIVFKLDDLKQILAALIEVDVSKINIEYEDMFKSSCCGGALKRVPLFKKITDILIDNKTSFKISYNSYAVQLQTEYNVSLAHVIVN
jgi:hypothetical protein